MFNLCEVNYFGLWFNIDVKSSLCIQWPLLVLMSAKIDYPTREKKIVFPFARRIAISCVCKSQV